MLTEEVSMAKAPVLALRITPGLALLSHYTTYAIRAHMRAPVMPNSDGRLRMSVPCRQTWVVPALALLLLALPISAWAGGFLEDP